LCDILTTQYDIALNGLKLAAEVFEIHTPEALKKVFEIMGYTDEQIEANFGHMFRALSYGAPPHGGIAWGLDRFISILMNESSIREVIAFAKTGEGKDLMMNCSKSEVSQKQFKELGIKLGK
jgi:aspartyl-tRNA synthetase